MPRRGQRDLDKEHFWRRMLRHWQSSGLSIHAFCLQHNLAGSKRVAFVAERPSGTRNRYPPACQRVADGDLERFVTKRVRLGELSGRLCEPNRPGLTATGSQPFLVASPLAISGPELPSSGPLSPFPKSKPRSGRTSGNSRMA
jgi:hypothetical protein